LIVLDRNNALIDETVAIRVQGFPPRQSVTITATQTLYDSSRWQAYATFTSDDTGCVSLAHQAPISGTYDRISPMGLIWSAERLPGEAQPVPVGSIMRPLPVDIEAVSRDGTRAHATFRRHVAGPGVTRHPIRSEGITGTLFLPPGAGPHPAVLVVSGGGGGIDEFRGAILASQDTRLSRLGISGSKVCHVASSTSRLSISRTRLTGCAVSHGYATNSWRYGAHREAVNSHYCSAQRFLRSMPSSPGCQAASCFGHSVLPSLGIRDRERRGCFAVSHCPIYKKTIRVMIQSPRRSPDTNRIHPVLPELLA
jgi:hypothetical protein